MGTNETPYDAYNMSVNKLKSYVVYSENAESFLDPDNTASVLVGAKGSGKSLLLRKKHLQLQEDDSNNQLVFSPRNGPRAPANKDDDMQWNNVGKALDMDAWQRHWLDILCLCAYNALFKNLFKNNKDDFDDLNGCLLDEFSFMEPECRSSNDIVAIYSGLLSALSRDEIPTSGGVFSKKFLAILEASPTLSRMVIYCDSLDESISDIKYPSDLSVVGDLDEAIRPWLYAQVGLALAQWHLRNLGLGITNKLSVFSSIRPDALPLINDKLRRRNVGSLQISDHFVVLSYTEKDLEKIARQVATDVGMDKGKLFAVRSNWRCFFRNESLFRALLRHTLLLPRQLIFLVQEINRVGASTNEGDPEFIASNINAIAAKLIAEYSDFFVPPWTAAFTEAFGVVNNSFILKSDWDQIDPHVREYALRCGLIGITSNDGARRVLKYRQYSVADTKKMSPADFFMMHPLLVELVCPQTGLARQDFSSGLFLGGEGEFVPSAQTLSAKSRITISGEPGRGMRAFGLSNKDVRVEFDRIAAEFVGLLCIAAVMFGRETPGRGARSARIDLVLSDLVRAMGVLIHHKLISPDYRWGLRIAKERIAKKLESKTVEISDINGPAFVSSADLESARSSIGAYLGADEKSSPIPEATAVLVAKIRAKRSNDWRTLRSAAQQLKALGIKMTLGKHGVLPEVESYPIRLEGCETAQFKVVCSRTSWPHPLELAQGSGSFARHS